MQPSRTNVRVTKLIERLDDSMHTLHGEANGVGADGNGKEVALVAWDSGEESYEFWIDLRPEALRVGDRVKAGERHGKVTHVSHGVEYGVKFDDGTFDVMRNTQIKRVLEPAETQ